MPVTERTFEQVVVEDPEGRWELHRGWLREKPLMSWNHTDVMSYVGFQLQQQLDRRRFRVHINGARLRRSFESYYMPDVVVVPTTMGDGLRDRPKQAEILESPLPLVVEVWSPLTGEYDVAAKLPEYQSRGDHEIWLIHPFERTLTAWRRQPDGSYGVTVYQSGTVEVESLPGVQIDLGVLFAD